MLLKSRAGERHSVAFDQPSEYERSSSRLLHHARLGFEVQTPSSTWQRVQHARGALTCKDWDAFHDPRATTHASRAELQRGQDLTLDMLLASIDGTDYDRRLSPEWLAVLDRVFAPLRYPVHALQMVASYLGALAPSGRLVIAGVLQSADETRRLERLAQRLAQLQRVHPRCGRASRATWERDEGWQPMRALIERLLCVYDWGEAFVALDAVVKPAFDQLFMLDFGRLASAAGDDVVAKLLIALYEDCTWHREWSSALIAMLVQDDAANAHEMAVWVERWKPHTDAAIDALIAMLQSDLAVGLDDAGKVAP